MPGSMLLLIGLLAFMNLLCCDGFELDDTDFLSPEELDDASELFIKDKKAYTINGVSVTHDEAVIMCKNTAANGQLAVIRNADTAQFIAIALSESDFDLEDLWIDGNRCGTNNQYCSSHAEVLYCTNCSYTPDWVIREEGTNRSSIRDCIGIQRKFHDHPLFMDLDCSLRRPFICEKDVMPPEQPVPGHSVIVGESIYQIFHGHATWEGAVQFCSKRSMWLATFRTKNETVKVGELLLISRPSLENTWIGGYYSDDKWQFLTTHREIPTVTDNITEFPPWKNNIQQKEVGCLLLDRHMRNSPVFWPARCERRRPILCEKHIELHAPISKLVTINEHDFLINFKQRSWQMAVKYCQQLNYTLVAPRDNTAVQILLSLMAETHTAIKHIWLGARLQGNKWLWEGGEPMLQPASPYPPLLNLHHKDMKCLNMDRENHNYPMWYGLHCNESQAFICVRAISTAAKSAALFYL